MRKIFTLFIATFFCTLAFSQVPSVSGHLGGSFESYSQLYQRDKKINAILPQDRVGSNNYLKLDYNNKQFSAGLQFEAYLPSIAGYPYSINQSKIINRFIKYGADKFSIQVGDFYEQFGSGLVFRSWENRQIGINNAVEGVNVMVKPLPFIQLKGIYGRQRKILDRSNSIVRGLDADVDITGINKNYIGSINFSVGGSYVTRYQQYTGPDPDFPATIKAAAARFSISGQSAAVNAEYVYKSKDPNINNLQNKTTGKAILINGSYAKKNLGINLNIRAMENLDFRGERDAVATIVPVNFIPALTKQHDYLTTNIYVYNAQPLAETGGQIDLFYNLKGNKNKPSRFAINFAHYRSLSDTNNIFSAGNNKYFQDFSIEWKKKWNTRWNITLAYYNLFYNKSIVEGGVYPNIKSNIIVLNALYKYSKRNSFRFELQNLFTKQDNGNWFAAVTEFGFAPKWNVFVSDLYNYGETNTHYPTIGGSYTKAGSRFAMSYGRQRAGLFCVGGICRFVPAATGITATLTTTFNN